jgi:hypothetical protein
MECRFLLIALILSAVLITSASAQLILFSDSFETTVVADGAEVSATPPDNWHTIGGNVNSLDAWIVDPSASEFQPYDGEQYLKVGDRALNAGGGLGYIWVHRPGIPPGTELLIDIPNPSGHAEPGDTVTFSARVAFEGDGSADWAFSQLRIALVNHSTQEIWWLPEGLVNLPPNGATPGDIWPYDQGMWHEIVAHIDFDEIAAKYGVENYAWTEGFYIELLSAFNGLDYVPVYYDDVVLTYFSDSLFAWDPYPADDDENVDQTVVLSWNAPVGVTNPTYDIYLGTDEPAVVNGESSVFKGNQTAITFDPDPDLLIANDYYWRVDVIVPSGPEYTGNIWRFTTIQQRAFDPFPDGTVLVHIDTILSWAGAPGGTYTHNVYFGNDLNNLVLESQEQSETFFDPDIDWSTTYFWRIDEVEEGTGHVYPGELWNFTTGRGKAWNPSPGDKLEGVDRNTNLSWMGDLFATSYDVYFGTDADGLVFKGNVSDTSYTDLPTLEEATTHYWRVDQLDNEGYVIVEGDLWNFTTVAEMVYCPIGDLNGNCEVEFNDLLILCWQWLDIPGAPADFVGNDGVTLDDYGLFAQNWLEKAGPLFISEFVASNSDTLLDGDGNSSDWIEIYNPTATAINLLGWYLTDELDNLTKWRFHSPVSVESEGFLVIFASGQDVDNYVDPNGYYHTNFNLGKEGEYLALVAPDGQTIVHEYSPAFPQQERDISYGLYNNKKYYFGTATPGAKNHDVLLGLVGDTKFSVDRGFYNDTVQVKITSNTPEAVIRYTTDGSTPTESHGEIYTADLSFDSTTVLRAVAFKPGWLPSNVDTHTYIFLEDVIVQPNNPSGFPNDWKGVYYVPGDLPPSGQVPADYEMDPDIVSGNENQVKDALLSLPTISIATEVDNLFDLETGIYSNSWEGGLAWERPASAEFFEQSGEKEFQVNCGLRIHGGWFRKPVLTNKHSFRLLFKSDYGPTKLEFPMFDDEDAADSFDSIVLRANGNDSYGLMWGANAQYIRDEFGRQLQSDMGHVSSHGIFVNLYVDGLYWGLYNVVERPEASFSATYFGGDKENWDVLKIDRITEQITVANGSMDAWDAMLDQVRSGLSTNEAYQRIQGNNPDGTPNESYPDYLEMENYIDYMIANLYVGNKDWPQWNWYAVRDHNDGRAGFRFLMWDTETSLDDVGINRTDVGSPTAWRAEYGPGVAEPYHELRNNAEFRMLFADRLHKAFFNGGPLTSEVTVARYSNIADIVDPAMIGECARWGDQLPSTPTIESWRAIRDWLLTSYFEDRSSIVLEQFRDGGLYPSLYPNIAAPVFHINGSYQHGGYIQAIANLVMVKPDGSGTLYYTLDSSDPRLMGGAVNPDALIFSSVVKLSQTVHVKSRLLDEGKWSALNEAVYAIETVAQNLRITEIMYHPDDPNTEFIELKNTGTKTINLNLVDFTEGIDFTFGSTNLEYNEHILIVENIPAFENKYGTGRNIAGQYIGALNNAGENITLVDAIGTVIHDFEYKDDWYDITDGDGFSLTIKEPAATDPNLWDNKKGWRPSGVLGGSPGFDDTGSIPPIGSIVINEILAHSDTLLYDWIELYNSTDAPINIGGWFLSDSNNDDPNRMKYEIPINTIIDANDYVVFNENLHFGNPSAEGCNIPFQLSENGETVYLQSGQGGVLTGYYEEEKFGASEADTALGRYKKSTGTFNFVAMSVNTPGAKNAYPKVGPVVITEIMYHPETNADAEYVELMNISGSAVTLYDSFTNEPWRFVDDEDNLGIEFYLPVGPPVTMAQGEKILLIKNAIFFELEYGPGSLDGITYFEWLDGSLSNGGEKPELQMPGDVDGFGTRYYIRVDRVSYDDVAPWPTEPDGEGESLTRISNTAYGNDVINWQAYVSSPGI